MSTMLASISSLLAQTFAEGSGWEWLNPIVDVLNEVLWPILILVGTAGMIYAVVLGVKLARAESADERDEAKKRIINAVIALIVIIALILLLKIFITYAPGWVGVSDKTESGSQTQGIASPMFVATKLALGSIF